MRVTYYVAASLDGYIAAPNGSISWIEEVGIPIEESGCVEFLATVDGLVMGRKTYEQVCGFGLIAVTTVQDNLLSLLGYG